MFGVCTGRENEFELYVEMLIMQDVVCCSTDDALISEWCAAGANRPHTYTLGPLLAAAADVLAVRGE